MLAAAEALYLKGGLAVLSGLMVFDRERRNIETGQGWAVGCVADDRAAAGLCVGYALRGAHTLHLRQHPRQRIGWLERAATAAPKIGDRRGEGAALRNLGVAYKNLGEPRRAIEFHEKHLAIAREIGDRRGEGTALGNLGNAYADLGEPHRAIGFLREALAIFEAIESPRAAQARATIAELEKEGGT